MDFTAKWCGPCKVIGPKFEAMEKDFPGVIFAKVDVDDAEVLVFFCLNLFFLFDSLTQILFNFLLL